MPRAQSAQKERTQLTLVLNGELFQRVMNHHRLSGLADRPQESARELIIAALDFPQVETSLLRSARQRAFIDARKQLYDRTRTFLEQLAREWEVAINTFDDAALLRSAEEGSSGDTEWR
jgi:hypothetical protein